MDELGYLMPVRNEAVNEYADVISQSVAWPVQAPLGINQLETDFGERPAVTNIATNISDDAEEYEYQDAMSLPTVPGRVSDCAGEPTGSVELEMESSYEGLGERPIEIPASYTTVRRDNLE